MNNFNPHLIYSLKGNSPKKFLERLKFGLLKAANEKRRLDQLEILEFEMILDRSYDVKDTEWINTNILEIYSTKTLYNILLDFDKSTEKLDQLTNFLKTNDHLKIHNAYFGKVNLNPPESILKARSRHTKERRRIIRFIGVGYKDKGNKRNLATDGTPDWKEVYSADKEEVIELSPMQKQFLGSVFGEFRNHPSQKYVVSDKEPPKNPFEKGGNNT